MTKDDLIDITSPSEKEVNLKNAIIDIINNSGKNEAVYTLTYRNTFFLKDLGIDENDFNSILFKNYLLFINNDHKQLNTDSLMKKDKVTINSFNNLLNDGLVKDAFDLYENNSIIFHALCSSYLKNLDEDNVSLVNGICDDKFNNIYNSYSKIKSSNLRYKNIAKKVYQRVSER